MSSLSYRLYSVARWLRIDAPLVPPAEQMAEFAEAARTLEALAAEVGELEDRLSDVPDLRDFDR